MNLPNPYKDDRGRVAGAYKMESLAWELFEQGRTLECSNILRTLDHFSVEAWLNLLYIAVKNEVGGQP